MNAVEKLNFKARIEAVMNYQARLCDHNWVGNAETGPTGSVSCTKCDKVVTW